MSWRVIVTPIRSKFTEIKREGLIDTSHHYSVLGEFARIRLIDQTYPAIHQYAVEQKYMAAIAH